MGLPVGMMLVVVAAGCASGIPPFVPSSDGEGGVGADASLDGAQGATDAALDVASRGDLEGDALVLPFDDVTIPSALAVPSHTTLKVRYHGVGTQVYTCAASSGGSGPATGPGSAMTFSWTFVAPNAVLFDGDGTEVGTQSSGPTWSSKDGSTVTGMQEAEDAAPREDAIPWLLLSASSHEGDGVFSDVTYVQSVDTTKGRAPAAPCGGPNAGMGMSVGFTADFYFYVGPVSAADAAAGTGDGG